MPLYRVRVLHDERNCVVEDFCEDTYALEEAQEMYDECQDDLRPGQRVTFAESDNDGGIWWIIARKEYGP